MSPRTTASTLWILSRKRSLQDCSDCLLKVWSDNYPPTLPSRLQTSPLLIWKTNLMLFNAITILTSLPFFFFFFRRKLGQIRHYKYHTSLKSYCPSLPLHFKNLGVISDIEAWPLPPSHKLAKTWLGRSHTLSPTNNFPSKLHNRCLSTTI